MIYWPPREGNTENQLFQYHPTLEENTEIMFNTELAPRPIQSISCNVCEETAELLYHIVLFFLKVSLLPFSKVQGQNYQSQKDCLQKILAHRAPNT